MKLPAPMTPKEMMMSPKEMKMMPSKPKSKKPLGKHKGVKMDAEDRADLKKGIKQSAAEERTDPPTAKKITAQPFWLKKK